MNYCNGLTSVSLACLWIFLLSMMYSCTPNKFLSYAETKALGHNQSINKIEFSKPKQAIIEELRSLYAAKEISVVEMYAINDDQFIIHVIKGLVKDSPRIVNVQSLPLSESFAQEVAHRLKQNIVNWDNFNFIIVELQQNKKGKRSFMFNTKNMQVIRLEEL